MTENRNYLPQIQEINRLSRKSGLIFSLGMAVSVLVANAINGDLGALVFVAVISGAHLTVRSLKCPSCSKPLVPMFYLSTYFLWLMARNCKNCGQQLFITS